MSVTLRYFNEYVYYRAVTNLGKYRAENGGEPLTTSQARALRTAVGKALEQNSVTVATANKTAMFSALREAFGPDGASAFTDADYTDAVGTFSRFTGIASASGSRDGATTFADPVVPLSPYDPAHALRDAFMRNGSQLLFARRGDIMTDRQTPAEIDPSTVPLQTARGLQTANGHDPWSTRLRLLSSADKSGASMLAPYMSQEEYETASAWMERAGEDDETKFMSLQALRKSAGLLRLMKENGISYEILADDNPGQLRARITGTRTSVRIADTRDNEAYIGRVYDNGIVYRYMTNKPVAQDVRLTEGYTPRNAQECFDLLQYAMGHSVRRWDDSANVGEATDVLSRRQRWTNGEKRFASVRVNQSYHSAQNASYFIGALPSNERYSVLLHADYQRGRELVHFSTPSAAEQYLKDAVSSARDAFAQDVRLDELIAAAAEHKDDEDYAFDFSGDEVVASVQRGYWDILTSKEPLEVYHPGAKYDAYLEGLDESDDDVAEAVSLRDVPTYEGTPEEKVRQHMADNLDYFIGTFEPDAEGLRFDPTRVSQYMSSAYSMFSNERNMIRVLRACDIPAEALRGNHYYTSYVKDNLIKFDPSTALPMCKSESPFVKRTFEKIASTIRESGCELDDEAVLMDAQGIVHYTASRITGRNVTDSKGNPNKKTFEGEIGQVFIPREDGMIETQFAGTDNYLFVPGYEASVVTGASTAGQTLEQRTRLRGYEQILHDEIAHTLRGDLMLTDAEVGSPAVLNSTYRHMYGERHPLDWVEQTTEEGMDDALRNAIIQTEARRVKYDGMFREGSTVNADYRANQYAQPGDIINDNFYSAYDASGRRNMALLSEEGNGYFDKTMTSSGMEQGMTRYLCEGTEVLPDGSMKPSDKGDAVPLMKHDAFRFAEFDPWDRLLMTSMNAIKASSITKPSKVALVTLDGLNSNDGFIVSSAFAEANQIRLPNGLIRPLQKGDKISDMHGNKGVISVVVDPEMDPEEAKEQNLSEAVKLFRNNPDLAVVGAPFSGVSRFNAGSVREMQSGEVSRLVGPDGEDLGEAVGEMRFIVTHLSADKKSNVYDPSYTPGKGRKAGAQMGMSITAMDCPAIMREFYGSNAGKLRNFRDVVIAFGGDISETGEFRSQYTAHAGEKRSVFMMPELMYTERNNASGSVDKVLNVGGMKQAFGRMISNRGGFMEVPFQLHYPNGCPIDKFVENQTINVNYQKLEWQVQRRNKDGSITTYTAHRHEDASTERTLHGHDDSYVLPVLSSHLRAEQDLNDGTTSLHSYTTSYLQIFESAIRYQRAKELGDKKEMERYQQAAQSSYDSLCQKLDQRCLSSKKNMVRDGILSAQVPNSATLVWCEDTSLPLDRIRMCRDKMEVMGLKDGDGVLMVRDPVLSESGIMWTHVEAADDIQGVAVNPAIAPRFEGDFDGDTVGIMVLHTPSAQKEAARKFSLAAALLNKEYKREDGTYDINLETGLDVASAHHHMPELAEAYEAIRQRANEIDASDMSPAAKRTANQELVDQLSEHYRACYASASCKEILRIGSPQQVIESMQAMVDHGTKGSHGKILKFAKFYGVDCETDADGRILPGSVKDLGHTRSTREDDMNSQVCTATKSCGTGIAGRYQHRGTEAFRNCGVEAEILHLTHPVTQALLQLKHEDKDTAYRMYDLLQGPVRAHWRGRLLEEKPDEHGNMKFSVAADGRQATPDEWKQQMMNLYTSKHGLGVKVNPDDVERVAAVMAKYGSDGRVADIEACNSRSIMDQMAYSGSRDVLYDAMEHGRSLFEGDQSARYMPNAVRANVDAAERGDSVKKIATADTQEAFKPKVKTSSAAPTVKRVDTSALKSEDLPNSFGGSDGAEAPTCPQ